MAEDHRRAVERNDVRLGPPALGTGRAISASARWHLERMPPNQRFPLMERVVSGRVSR